MKTKKIIKICLVFIPVILILLTLLLVDLFGGSIRRRYFPSHLEVEFALRVEKAVADKADFDLTEFDLVKWNNLFFIFPYHDTKNLPFKYQGPFISSTDDGEMYAVLLNGDEYVASIAVQRGEIDFSTCGDQNCLDSEKWVDGRQFDEECRCTGVIKKENAIFEVDYSKIPHSSVKLKRSSE